jgi:beta-galactosidase/beta-glucuronidase
MKSISSRRASCLWLFLIGLGLVLVPASAAGDEPVPRPEHPRPDMFRADWINLNGSWDFAFDLSSSGEERGLPEGRGFDRTITVPFAPESSLSGVGFKDFMPVVWYKRTVTFPDTWCGKRLLLHFEACDYLTTVWVNGRKAGSHEGGYTPFTFDITRLFVPGPNLIVVRAADDTRSGRQPIGKPS